MLMTDIQSLPIVDAHFHGSLCVQKGKSLETLLTELNEASFAIDAGVEARDFESRVSLYSRLPVALFFAVGISPGSLRDSLDYELSLLQEHAKHPKIVAIGEIGLDFYHMKESVEDQLRVFTSQLELACSLGLPVIIHSREAFKLTLEALDSASPLPGVMMHCFSYGTDEAMECTKRGFYLSFAGNVSYKRSRPIREALRACPLDRMLIETDSPYLAPEPFRGTPSSPSSSRFTLAYAAEQRGVDPMEFGQMVLENAQRLFL